MTLKEKIGQMIMTGFPKAQVTPELADLIENDKIGNIILFEYNQQNIPQLRELCLDIHRRIEKSTGHPAFIGVDQEGGVVTRLPKEASNIPGAMLIGATARPEYAYQAGLITGNELKAFGINLNFAPVMDVNSNPDNPVIGVRSYSSDPEMVKEFGINMQKGLLEEGVMATAKHFPGHGDTAVDSHLGLPVIDKDLDQLMKEELIPFKAAIAEGVPCIMSSHILFPKIEKEKTPATMSKAILTELLRDKLGFKGLIITDCLEMGAIKDFYGTPVAAVEAIKAGAQILCISHTPSVVKESIEKIEAAVKAGDIPMKLIDAAVANILKYKKQFQIDLELDHLARIGCLEHKETVKEITLAGITKLSPDDLPDFTKDTLVIGSLAYRSTLASSHADKGTNFAKYIGHALKCSFLELSVNPEAEEINKVLVEASKYKNIIYGLYNGHLNTGQITLANKISSLGQTLTAVTLRNPTDLDLLDEKTHKIAAYEYNMIVFDSLIKILKKEASAEGLLPSRGSKSC